VNAGQTLTKAGGGTLAVLDQADGHPTVPANAGVVSVQAGASVRVEAGSLTAAGVVSGGGALVVGTASSTATAAVKNVTGVAVTVANGSKLTLTGGGQVAVFNSLDLGAASGLLETGTNHFIIDLGAGATEAAARAAYQQVRQWFLNQSDGVNPNQGIRPANADNLHWLTILNNERGEMANWQGVNLDAVLGHRNAIVAMWTWKGDLNADGRLTGDDYFTIDGNINGYDPLTGYPVGVDPNDPNAVRAELSDGDVNGDGRVTGDDYFLLDGLINQFDPLTGLPFPLAAGGTGAGTGTGGGEVVGTLPVGGTSAVPEPGALGALAIAATGLLAKRRRRRA